VNGRVRPRATLGLVGVTAIESSAAAVTVNVVDPLIGPSAAVIVVVPTSIAVASPALLTVATAVVSDDHVTCAVRSCVVASVNVPIAVNGRVRPRATLGAAGVIAIDASTEPVAVTLVVPEIALGMP